MQFHNGGPTLENTWSSSELGTFRESTSTVFVKPQASITCILAPEQHLRIDCSTTLSLYRTAVLPYRRERRTEIGPRKSDLSKRHLKTQMFFVLTREHTCELNRKDTAVSVGLTGRKIPDNSRRPDSEVQPGTSKAAVIRIDPGDM